MMRRLLMVLAVLLGVCTSGLAMAQEIQLTGPLAGAPAVRKLRLRRQGRLEVAPTATFSLLDEYQRTVPFIGGRLTYNITDWLGLGVWGAAGVVKVPTALSDHIDEVTQARRKEKGEADINNRLTDASIHPTDFAKQLGRFDWIVSPQITLVPFRGKLAIFQKIFVDTDIFLFGGPAFVGVTERQNCNGNCAEADSYKMKSRTAITGTFGVGLTFYLSQWMSLGLEWRGLPLAWNTGGFDKHGGGPEARFPDLKIDEKDRDFKLNMQAGVSLGFYLPTKIKNSE